MQHENTVYILLCPEGIEGLKRKLRKSLERKRN